MMLGNQQGNNNADQEIEAAPDLPTPRPARGPYKKKAKIDPFVQDPSYLWAVENFPARTVLSIDLFQEAINRGVSFFKSYKRDRIDAEGEELHCSIHSSHHLSAFYVKAVTFPDGIVSVQMNGNCIAINDFNREETAPIFSPSRNAAVSAHRADGSCGTGLCKDALVDGELYCEFHLAENRRRDAERIMERRKWKLRKSCWSVLSKERVTILKKRKAWLIQNNPDLKKQDAINSETGCFHCGKVFNGAPIIHTIQGNERKFFDIDHKEKYLTDMKDAAEKASAERKVKIDSFMYHIGCALSQRSNLNGAAGWTLQQAIAILYHIALEGEFVATDALFPLAELTDEQITAVCLRLETGDFPCYWCGVNLSFFNRVASVNPDRLDSGLNYFEMGQTTVRSCTFCQFLFNKESLARREQMIDELLSNRYRPNLADLALELYENKTTDQEATIQGIDRINNHCDYWAAKWNSQSFEHRTAWAATSWTNVTEDIRDWTQDDCCEFGRLFDNRCVVTGFSPDDVQESISIDRIWDDGRYTEQDCMPLWWPLNRAKGKVHFFKTKDAFLAYKTLRGLDGLSHRKAAVIILREALERLRAFQREKRLTVA